MFKKFSRLSCPVASLSLLENLPCSWAFFFLAFTSFLPSEAQSFGGANREKEEIQATPYRHIELARISAPPFYLPSGNRINMNTDLSNIIDTEINQSRYFRSARKGAALVISGGVTSMEMDVKQLNIRFGWNPSGPLPVFSRAPINGEFDLRLSTLSMDFKIYDKVSGETYLASYTNETLSKLRFSVRIHISELRTTIDLLTKTELTKAIRKATREILRNMEESQSFHYIPWEAKVSHVNKSANSLSINAGILQGVQEKQAFSIYAACEERENFCYERFLSDIRINSSSSNHARGEPLRDSDSFTGILPGDKVYIKVLAKD